MLVTVVCAVALAWWRERSLIEQLDKTREELRDYQVGVEYYQLVTRGAAAIDRNDPRQQKAFDSLEWFLLYGPPFFASAQSSEVSQGLGREPLEILLFQAPCIRHSGAGLCMILREDENVGSQVLDVVEFTFWRQTDHARLKDVDGDGRVELTVDLALGSDELGKAQTLAYSIGRDGFRARPAE
jgi:hypothetical protein